MSTLLLCAVLAADPVPPHLAETVYQSEVNAARKAYHEAVQKAEQRMKSALYKAWNAAREPAMRNAYKERYEAIAAMPDPVSPIPAGTWEVKFSDTAATTETYIFREDGEVAMASNPGKPEPVRWIFSEGFARGFAYWPDDRVLRVFIFDRIDRPVIVRRYKSDVTGRMELVK